MTQAYLRVENGSSVQIETEIANIGLTIKAVSAASISDMEAWLYHQASSEFNGEDVLKAGLGIFDGIREENLTSKEPEPELAMEGVNVTASKFDEVLNRFHAEGMDADLVIWGMVKSMQSYMKQQYPATQGFLPGEPTF
jgi:hypothetical protein